MVALGGVGLWAGVNGIGKSMVDLTADEIVISAKVRTTPDRDRETC